MAAQKRLVVCFDGTWNAADSERAETNVVKLARAIPVRDPAGILQLVLYLRGVGTGSMADKVLGGATGEGVENNLRSGYMFIAQNYEPGDEIFLFGFSRGAFTARSLSGFISAAGLLKSECLRLIFEAWQYYRTPRDNRDSANFHAVRASNCHEAVRIKCVGVWDTVGALGIPASAFASFNLKQFGFHDTQPSDMVENAFHALAVDEMRDEFVPTLWTMPDSAAEKPVPRVEQVWFAGAHSDVGGGYDPKNALSDIPLLWMAERAQSCGLHLSSRLLPDKLTLNPLAVLHDARKVLSYSALDLLRPTLREVCGTTFKAALNEKAYWPQDEKGERLVTIGERLHWSVVDRFGKKGAVYPSATLPYRPKNLEPAVKRAQADQALISL
jgi:uncharacterized protein (DUF2235 family)